jgi:hypothetical protein
MKPIRAGIAFAITVAVFYALCTLAWVLAPDRFIGFMNSLFHGLDFTSLVQSSPFTWPVFLFALLVLSTWALLAGTFFAWLLNRLTR